MSLTKAGVVAIITGALLAPDATPRQDWVVRDFECVSGGVGSAFCSGSVTVCDNGYRLAQPGEAGSFVVTEGKLQTLYCRTYAATDVAAYLCASGGGPPVGFDEYCFDPATGTCCAIRNSAMPQTESVNKNFKMPEVGGSCSG